jgi:hypothetical protein
VNLKGGHMNEGEHNISKIKLGELIRKLATLKSMDQIMGVHSPTDPNSQKYKIQLELKRSILQSTKDSSFTEVLS